jgi:kinesin family protein C1
VFDEIKPFVQTALDGMNTCIFAYGQTGSGKTHTMEGPCIEDDVMRGSFIDHNRKPVEYAGILPRVACFLESEMERHYKMGKPLEIEVSALEIYCENIRDMLLDNGNPIL